MRKLLGIAALGLALVVGLACSGDAGSTSTPTSAAAPALQNVTGAAAPAKDMICHYNAADEPYGVVVEVSAKTWKRHAGHLDAGLDCEFTYDYCVNPKSTCTYSQCDDACS